ncbi:hypothetical protein [Salipiger mangrovisoli]|uniref:Uncharacterized protein n=1 Tax=Salipiger mangrovisoli TaxID=2865933 RepID=A0ABR9X3P5_9RHOB|nr:hypothetical protein [Salipiger mangrovisoli]MBE9638131.1 hypothetical protein [Salipiger mangrovisoli]
MAHYHRFYRQARDFGVIKALTLIGLLVLTQALATLESDPEEEARLKNPEAVQVLPAALGAAERDVMAWVGTLI